MAIIGDAPLPLSIDEALRALGFVVLEGYGSTEQCVTVMRSPRLNVTGTAGRPLPGTRLLVLDEERRPVPPGTIGELVVRGPQVFPGYHLAKDADRYTSQPFVTIDQERYLLTGDLGCFDFHGNVIVIGRKEHAIVLGDGRRVYPEVIEEPFRSIRIVERVIVIGQGLALPVALIVPNPDELYRFVVGRPRMAHRSRPPVRALILKAGASEALVHLLQVSPSRDLPLELSGPGRIVFLSHPFNPRDEITPTLKPRRHIIAQRYHELAIRALDQPNFVRGDFQVSKIAARS